MVKPYQWSNLINGQTSPMVKPYQWSNLITGQTAVPPCYSKDHMRRLCWSLDVKSTEPGERALARL
jgi:hypothetical protein